MAYVEEAFKLDVRAIMSAALKTGKKSQYSVTISCPTGYLISVDLHENADRVATASITVNWPENAEDQVSGGIFLEYRGYEGRAAEQTLYLTGTPAKIGGWQWTVRCPETKQELQALYLAPDGDRFLSRAAAGLKYQQARSKRARALKRGLKIMQKLKTHHWGPGIGKPPGMSSRKFDKLNYQLTKEHIRYLSGCLGSGDPEFYDEEPPANAKHPPARPSSVGGDHLRFIRDKTGNLTRRAQYKFVCDQSLLFRDKSGSLQMNAKFKKRFGLDIGDAAGAAKVK